MMVEQEPAPEENLEEPTNQKDGVGRITGMDRIEPARQEYPPGKDNLPKQRGPVLQQVTQGSHRVQGQMG